MSTPSLLLVPARLKDGTLFSQIPTNGSGDFTVVQAVGNATRVNASGFVESAKTNLALQSEGFNVSATWTSVSGGTGVVPVVTQATGIVDPAGGTTAERIQLSVGSGTLSTDFSILRQTLTFTAVVHTFSVYLRSATSGSQFVAIRFNSAPQTIIEITPSWQQFTFTGTPSAGSRDFGFDLRGNNTSASGSADFYAWGAQLEVGSSPSDYIPTTTVARTKFSGVTVNGTSIANVPRLDYLASGGTVGCPGLLVEPAGTNLALQSENFSTTWSPTNTVVSGNVAGTTDPAGGNTADQIFETAASGNHFLAQTMTIASGTTYVGSVFYKKAAGSPDWMQVAFSTTGLAGFANFNLTSGTVGLTGAGCTGRIENYGNGWYRCILIQTATANGTSGGPIIVFTNNTNSATRFVSYAGNTATSIYAWGAQLETGSVATSYIPTTTGSVPRNADVISVSGNVSGSIGQTEGSIYAEVNIQKLLGTTQRAFVDIGQAGNRLFLGYGNGLTNQIRFLLQTSGGGLVDFQSATTTTGTIRIAIGYKNSDSAMYVNGVKALPISNGSFTASLSSLTQLSIGSSFSVGETHFLNDRINAVALYATRLSDDALMLLSMQGNDTYLPQAIWNFYVNSRTGNTEVPTCLYERHADIIDV